MLRWERGTVVTNLPAWSGVVRCEVQLEGGERVPALAYPELTGAPSPGEVVLLNTNALRRGLGTGGQAFVVARPDAIDAASASAGAAQPDPAGHMVKARYTPMQTVLDAIDDPASPHHALLQDAEDLGGMPVVVTDLHSALPAVVAGIRETDPDARIVHVHTDAAALPAAFSRTAAELRERELVQGVISCGQAFGGEHEAVTVHSALLGARHVLDADVVIAVQGPGTLGSGTPWGFSGLQLVESLHAVHVLGGTVVAALRVSEGDARERHHGLSHHASTTLGRAALAPALLPLLSPADPGYSAFHALVAEQVDSMIIDRARMRGVEHRSVEVPGDGLRAALERIPVRLSTMGRSLAEDPAAFLFGALAGRAAAQRITRG